MGQLLDHKGKPVGGTTQSTVDVVQILKAKELPKRRLGAAEYRLNSGMRRRVDFLVDIIDHGRSERERRRRMYLTKWERAREVWQAWKELENYCEAGDNYIRWYIHKKLKNTTHGKFLVAHTRKIHNW